MSTGTIGYFDCFSGAAGDMIIGACLGAGLEEKDFRSQLEKLSLPEVEIKIEAVVKKGIHAVQFQPVIHSGDAHFHEHHHHRNLPTILNIIEEADLSPKVKKQAQQIFERLGQAEAKVHDIPIEKVHFHEVGAADAIVDIVGACLAMEMLGIERVYVSALTAGTGTVRCEHGVLPVPAPATAELIKGVPVCSSDVQAELLTPTGAAILTTLAEGFGAMPAMSISRIGYGAGRRDLPDRANVLRLLVGESAADSDSDLEFDSIQVLEANLDDCSGEWVGHLTDCLRKAGALDVYCTAIAMKQNRPGTKVTVLCRLEDQRALEEILFRESTTFGIRSYGCTRKVLARSFQTVQSPYGAIRIKEGVSHGEKITAGPEYQDCLDAARKHQVPLKEVYQAAMECYRSGGKG